MRAMKPVRIRKNPIDRIFASVLVGLKYRVRLGTIRNVSANKKTTGISSKPQRIYNGPRNKDG